MRSVKKRLRPHRDHRSRRVILVNFPSLRFKTLNIFKIAIGKTIGARLEIPDGIPPFFLEFLRTERYTGRLEIRRRESLSLFFPAFLLKVSDRTHGPLSQHKCVAILFSLKRLFCRHHVVFRPVKPHGIVSLKPVGTIGTQVALKTHFSQFLHAFRKDRSVFGDPLGNAVKNLHVLRHDQRRDQRELFQLHFQPANDPFCPDGR